MTIKELTNENASGGASSASSVADVVMPLGNCHRRDMDSNGGLFWVDKKAVTETDQEEEMITEYSKSGEQSTLQHMGFEEQSANTWVNPILGMIRQKENKWKYSSNTGHTIVKDDLQSLVREIMKTAEYLKFLQRKYEN